MEFEKTFESRAMPSPCGQFFMQITVTADVSSYRHADVYIEGEDGSSLALSELPVVDQTAIKNWLADCFQEYVIYELEQGRDPYAIDPYDRREETG